MRNSSVFKMLSGYLYCILISLSESLIEDHFNITFFFFTIRTVRVGIGHGFVSQWLPLLDINITICLIKKYIAQSIKLFPQRYWRAHLLALDRLTYTIYIYMYIDSNNLSQIFHSFRVRFEIYLDFALGCESFACRITNDAFLECHPSYIVGDSRKVEIHASLTLCYHCANTLSTLYHRDKGVQRIV